MSFPRLWIYLQPNAQVEIEKLRVRERLRSWYPRMYIETTHAITNYLNSEIRRPYADTMVSVEFEVFGNVQGVFFNKYCREMCCSLGLRGWVRNSRKGTVVGKMEGPKDKVDEMAMWLRLQGSPGSRIEHCAFRNWSIIDSFDFRDFRILY